MEAINNGKSKKATPKPPKTMAERMIEKRPILIYFFHAHERSRLTIELTWAKTLKRWQTIQLGCFCLTSNDLLAGVVIHLLY
jgi:hypothetical protein